MDTVHSHPAYAKINLHLAIGLPYPDGYHPIQSVFALVSLHDTVEVEWKESSKFSIEVDGLDAYCDAGKDTLAQAASLWHEAGGRPMHLKVRCLKQIPVKAGLGGGSSDAATLLSLLQAMEEEPPIDGDQLFELALRVGSDVPFFLSRHHCAVVTGRGETVVPLDLRELFVVLVMPTFFDVSTALAYRNLDEIPNRSELRMMDEQELTKVLQMPTSDWKHWLYNDFQSCVGHDSYYNKLFAASEGHSGYASLSGSGACWFFISENRDEVDAVKKKIERGLKDQVDCWMASTLPDRELRIIK